MHRRIIVSHIFIILICSCGNSSRNNTEYVLINDYPTTEVGKEDGQSGYDDYIDSDERGTPDIGNIRLTGKSFSATSAWDMVWCKMVYMVDCRYDQLDVVFNTLPADSFDGLD